MKATFHVGLHVVLYRPKATKFFHLPAKIIMCLHISNVSSQRFQGLASKFEVRKHVPVL